MSIDNILMQATSEAVKELYGLDFAAEKVTLQTTKKEFEGNFTVVVFPFVKRQPYSGCISIFEGFTQESRSYRSRNR